MSSFVIWLYGLWQLIPAGVRAGLAALVVAVVGVALAFNWTLPADWAGLKAEIVAFWLVVVPVVWQVWQKSIWPPLFTWILSLLHLQATSTKPPQLLRTA